MKNKKIVMYISVIIIVIILLVVGYIVYTKAKINSNKEIKEYIPEEEISEEQLRQTIITLYFLEPNTYTLETETRKIDSKELIDNPYNKIVNLLIEGPQNENLIKLIPQDAYLNNSEIREGILYLDFSEHFINGQNLGKEQEELIVKSIVNTLSQLTEVNGIKILIDGKEGRAFPDGELTFEEIFIRE